MLAGSADLSGLENLSYLDLSANALETIGPVAALAFNWDDDNSGLLQSLFLACNPTFDCSTLALDVENGKNIPIVGTSHCAAFNSQDDQWILKPHPDCPPGN